jgi:multiple sugar transport system ATP-binding protein
MAEIKFERVEKRFKDVVVVKDLSMTIEDKEFFTFVGPSGCGKSTVLNMVAGLENVSDGRITFDGAVVNDLPPGERDVAMVFQSYALYPHMTVYDNMAFPLKIKKEPPERIGSEINRVASLLGLESLLKRKPKALSGGQRQRVALGRAIIRKPRVFLMDEPLSNLDARLRIEMRRELKRLHKEFPITTVYVTHDQEEAMALSDRIAVLNQGEIQQCDHPMEVYTKPANLFVAGFIGSPPMNIIEGSLIMDLPFISFPIQKGQIREIVAGIRPSDVTVSIDPGQGDLEGEVIFVEPTGSERWVDILWERIHIKGRAKAGQEITPGRKVFFKFPEDALHFFDKLDGKRIIL